MFIASTYSENSEINDGRNVTIALSYYDAAVARVTKFAYTAECKAKIMNEYHKYLYSFSTEEHFPYERTMYHTQCPTRDNVNPVSKFVFCCV